MTTPMLVSGKASAPGTLKLAVTKCARQYSIPPGQVVNGKHVARVEDPETQRELFVNVLNANATRRDAKQYLARFKNSRKSGAEKPDLYALLEERNARHRQDQERLDRMGVNLGGLYAPARAIADAPQFGQADIARDHVKASPQQELHIALACLRSPEKISDASLDGLARTLAQLVRLDMRIIVVLDPNLQDPSNPEEVRALRKLLVEQADRLCDAIDRHNLEGARPVPNALEVADDMDVQVTLPNLLIDPLRRGMVPVVPSLAYTTSGKIIPVSVTDVMTGLTKHITDLALRARDESEIVSLDRIIVLDSIGGIPSKDRGDGAHIFINLEQEFDSITQELSEYGHHAEDAGTASAAQPTVYEKHQDNMDLVRKCLALLPPNSSALIVTPEEAASSSRKVESKDPTLGAGTRRQRNPLIHNLLTNKPLISSSLPRARFVSSDNEAEPLSAATVLRRGMPIKIIPAAPRAIGWQPPSTGSTTLRLDEDPQVDLPRLVHLIEDSFRRKINVAHYLDRVHGRLAGLIIAGDYEGGAILTWERPPGADGDPQRLVPYLDKFAVLQSSQGSSGVADIVFQAMVRTCFPRGVCWRSRKDNPVNKWYFERAAGTWQIPDSNWTMFWTGNGVVEDKQRWEDYVGVCSNITASWDDDGRKPD